MNNCTSVFVQKKHNLKKNKSIILSECFLNKVNIISLAFDIKFEVLLALHVPTHNVLDIVTGAACRVGITFFEQQYIQTMFKEY